MSNPNPFQPSAAQGNYPQQGQLQQQQTADQRSEFIVIFFDLIHFILLTMNSF